MRGPLERGGGLGAGDILPDGAPDGPFRISSLELRPPLQTPPSAAAAAPTSF